MVVIGGSRLCSACTGFATCSGSSTGIGSRCNSLGFRAEVAKSVATKPCSTCQGHSRKGYLPSSSQQSKVMRTPVLV